jgi:hypothetical protein
MWDQMMLYHGNGVFEQFTLSSTSGNMIQCNCSIQYRRIPFNLADYESGKMYQAILTDLEPSYDR